MDGWISSHPRRMDGLIDMYLKFIPYFCVSCILSISVVNNIQIAPVALPSFQFYLLPK